MLDAPEKPSAGKRDLSGNAYGRPVQHPDEELIGVKAGTPAGEWLRRYWHPIAVSSTVTNRPRKVKLLGEELIIFRDGQGKVGLLYPRCMHRGTSLYYGRVEENGIRCCYHGWLFDTEGHCLEQPCEPEGGLRKDAARQPWYPTEERYGLVFAYMGPPEKMPILPRYDILEDLDEGEYVQGWGGDGSVARVDSAAITDHAPYHWTHAFDNVMDPYHAPILHSWFTEEQIAAYKANPQYTPRAWSVKDFPDKVEWERCGLGVACHTSRDLVAGRAEHGTSYAMLPNAFVISSTPAGATAASSDPAAALRESRPRHVTWYVATDDEELEVFNASRVTKPFAFAHKMSPDGRTWSQLTEEEHQDYPGDFEAQWGQGSTTLHSEEHLAQSDIGVSLLRRVMAEQIRAVQAGQDPLGVAFDEAKATVQVVSGRKTVAK